ncbi:MAG: enoyl-CoA hydratase/isomerase family protein [Streptosporangiaceae bacterium]|jgi:enoyl-CoA hydratase
MIEVARGDGIARLTLGDGKRANALGSDDWARLVAIADELGADDSLRVVVVSGSGRSPFSSGSDMREWIDATPEDVDSSFHLMEQACEAIERLPVPVIASVRGVAAGAGCQLACACDLRIVGERAKIGMPIARWGILVSPAFAARLVVLAGPDTARELLYTGRLLTGPEAVGRGLATRCVPERDLERVTDEFAAMIAAQPAAAIRAAKRAVEATLAPTRLAVSAQQATKSADYAGLRQQVERFLRGPA